MPGFDQIHGQDSAIQRLGKTLTSQRQPHAFIFAGPAGVGRQTTATALAEALLCEDPPAPAAACGRCVSCNMMQAGSHPDFQRVYKELAAYHDDPAVRNRVMQELGIEVIRRFLIAPAQQ
jgi:DNA polymerase-3 subunit delta'